MRKLINTINTDDCTIKIEDIVKHGGKRKGAGRKPCTDKIQQVKVGFRTSTIEFFGGEKALQEIIKANIYELLETGKKKATS